MRQRMPGAVRKPASLFAYTSTEGNWRLRVCSLASWAIRLALPARLACVFSVRVWVRWDQAADSEGSCRASALIRGASVTCSRGDLKRRAGGEDTSRPGKGPAPVL